MGYIAAETAARLGVELMPWQQDVFDVVWEVDPATGGLWYGEVDFTVPRQNGKTLMAMVAKTARCTRFGARQNVIYVAQTGKQSRKKWEDEHVYQLEHCQGFRSPRDFTVRKSNGSEAILWRNGSKWGPNAPTREAGHGDTLDHVDIDEAFAHTDDRVEQAVRPTMITRPSAQIWVYSTAGDRQSYFWWRKVLAGREACEAGDKGRVAYFEWSAPDDADPADPVTWRACNPALGFTIHEDRLAAEWGAARRKGVDGVDLFRRAYLNQWPEVPVLDDMPGMWQVVTEAEWRACASHRAELVGVPSIGVDTTPDRAWSSVGVASPDHVEVADHRPGTAWVVQRIADIVQRWGAVAIVVDPAGPAGSMLDELRAAHGDLVVTPTLRDLQYASQGFADTVGVRGVSHRGQSELDAAVSVASKRPVGDAWLWGRAGVAPISPLVAVTMAWWAARRQPEPSSFFAF